MQAQRRPTRANEDTRVRVGGDGQNRPKRRVSAIVEFFFGSFSPFFLLTTSILGHTYEITTKATGYTKTGPTQGNAGPRKPNAGPTRVQMTVKPMTVLPSFGPGILIFILQMYSM